MSSNSCGLASACGTKTTPDPLAMPIGSPVLLAGLWDVSPLARTRPPSLELVLSLVVGLSWPFGVVVCNKLLASPWDVGCPEAVGMSFVTSD